MAKSARKTAKAAKPKSAPRAKPSDPKAALREALLRMVAAGGWRDLSYADIARTRARLAADTRPTHKGGI